MAKKERIYTTWVFIYALELEENCYYIGQSIDVERRVIEHQIDNEGASWTKKHKFIRLLESYETETKSSKIGEYFEDQMTIKYMKKFGWKNVRGGNYFYTNEQKIRSKLIAHKISKPELNIDFEIE